MAVKLRIFVALASAVAAAAAHAGGEPVPQLAYLAVADGYWEAWVSRVDGTKARQVTRSKSDKTRVSWYPDGKALLVTSNDGALFKVDLDGNETRIALEQFPILDGVLSPDGTRIAYSFNSARDGNDIWVANSDGTNAQKLFRMAALQHEPSWSADGKQIYFLSGDGGQAHDIWRVALEGRQLEQLTVGDLYHFDVAVSASGAMAFSSNRNGNYELYVQEAGKPAEALTDDPALDGRPAFSPDGSSVIFESSRGGSLNLWLIDVKSRALKQITRHREGARAPAWYLGGVR